MHRGALSRSVARMQVMHTICGGSRSAAKRWAAVGRTGELSCCCRAPHRLRGGISIAGRCRGCSGIARRGCWQWRPACSSSHTRDAAGSAAASAHDIQAQGPEHGVGAAPVRECLLGMPRASVRCPGLCSALCVRAGRNWSSMSSSPWRWPRNCSAPALWCRGCSICSQAGWAAARDWVQQRGHHPEFLPAHVHNGPGLAHVLCRPASHSAETGPGGMSGNACECCMPACGQRRQDRIAMHV
jgi:hypothetical protein